MEIGVPAEAKGPDHCRNLGFETAISVLTSYNIIAKSVLRSTDIAKSVLKSKDTAKSVLTSYNIAKSMMTATC